MNKIGDFDKAGFNKNTSKKPKENLRYFSECFQNQELTNMICTKIINDWLIILNIEEYKAGLWKNYHYSLCTH